MLEMNNQRVKQLAMSRNHQNEGDKKVPYMSIAYTETTLTEHQVDGLMGQFAYRSWFNINGSTKEPMEWTGAGESLVCKKAFKDVSASVQIDKQELEFDGCRLYIDDFKLLNNGDVLIDWHLHVMGATDSEWIRIGRAEYSEVLISLGDGVLIERKSRKQRELPLEGGSDVGTETRAENGTTPMTGAHLVQPDETPIWWQHGTTGEQWQGKRCDLPAGCVEIDPPSGSRSEREQITAAKLDGPVGEDTQAFENGVARAVGAHRKRGSNVIDGRSERVKHQDEKRGAH